MRLEDVEMNPDTGGYTRLLYLVPQCPDPVVLTYVPRLLPEPTLIPARLCLTGLANWDVVVRFGKCLCNGIGHFDP